MSSVTDLRQLRLAKKAALDAKKAWERNTTKEGDHLHTWRSSTGSATGGRSSAGSSTGSLANKIKSSPRRDDWGRRRSEDTKSRGGNRDVVDRGHLHRTFEDDGDDSRGTWHGGQAKAIISQAKQEFLEINSVSSTESRTTRSISRRRESRSRSRRRPQRNGSNEVFNRYVPEYTGRLRESSESQRHEARPRPSSRPKPEVPRATDAPHKEESRGLNQAKAKPSRKPSLSQPIIYRPSNRSEEGTVAERSRSGQRHKVQLPDCSENDAICVEDDRDEDQTEMEDESEDEDQDRPIAVSDPYAVQEDPLREFWSEREQQRSRSRSRSCDAVEKLRQKRLQIAKQRKEAKKEEAPKKEKGCQRKIIFREATRALLRGRQELSNTPKKVTLAPTPKKVELAPRRPIRRGHLAPINERTKTDWASRCRAWHNASTEEGAIEIEMSGQNMDDENMGQWCCWMATKLSGSVYYKAKVVDFSDNKIGEHGTRQLMELFEYYSVTCDVLKLYKNELNDEALMEVAKFLTSFNRAPVTELHLTHNRISCQGVKWLLSSLAMHPAYPRWCENQRQYVPLWLRLEVNDFSSSEGVQLLENCREELDISVCLVQEKGCCVQKCCVPAVMRSGVKHNCIAHLLRFVDDVSAAGIQFRVKRHTEPLFRDSAIKIPWSIHARRQRPFLIYEDESIAVVFKPSDWICTIHNEDIRWGDWSLERRESKIKELMTQTQPASLYAWIILHFGRRETSTETQQYGLVHRLDRDTSGPLLIGKTDEGYRHGKAQIFKQSLMKDYICLVHGRVEDKPGECHAPIDNVAYKFDRSAQVNFIRGMPAISLFEPISFYENPLNGHHYSLVHVRIVTGRTHQIRLHMQHLGHPIVGERKYLKRHSTRREDDEICRRIFLHKYRIGFTNLASEVVIRSCPLQMSWDLWNTVEKHLQRVDENTFTSLFC